MIVNRLRDGTITVIGIAIDISSGVTTSVVHGDDTNEGGGETGKWWSGRSDWLRVQSEVCQN